MPLRPQSSLPHALTTALVLGLLAAGPSHDTQEAPAPRIPQRIESVPEAVAVRTATAEAGPGYGFFGTRWDPCRPITYRVALRQGYPGSVDDVRRAFRRAGRLAGVRFVYQGRTSRIAFDTGRDPRADITVSWATPHQVPGLRGGVAGLANTSVVVHDGVWENVKGQIALDGTQGGLRRGFARSGSPTWGQALLHEIGHVLGLDHVDERNEVMYRTIGRRNHDYGPGDRRRLHRVGRAAGCIPDSRR
ncbi:matrixin family metalloprotease [Marmoricola sp. RAF53]|uniref:matrixin family metalloprotease n=1 Tax=Marmoricola sp. RAF53 TaxID=3233059 RepID=UPI003F95C7A9